MQCPRYALSSIREILWRSVDTKLGYLILSKPGVSIKHHLQVSTRGLRLSSPSTTQHYHTHIRKKGLVDNVRVQSYPAADGTFLHQRPSPKVKEYPSVRNNIQNAQTESPNRSTSSRGAQRLSSPTFDELLPLVNGNKGGNVHNLKSGDRPENPIDIEPLSSDISTSTSMDRDSPFLDESDGESMNDTIQLPSTQERENPKYPPRESWQIQKKSLLKKFGPSGWSPRKRLSPDALDGIRALHSEYPEKYTTPVLAELFKVSPEAVRRIIRSKWRANEEEEEERRKRWDRRGKAIWSQMVEIGIKPPKKWRDMGVGKNMKRSVATNETKELKHRFGDISRDRKVQEVSPNGHQPFQGISLSDRIL